MFVVPEFSVPLPVATTANGSIWSYFEDFGVNHIYYGNGQFHASERIGNDVYTSADGLAWTKQDSTDAQQNEFHPNYAVFFNGAFYAGSANRIYKSPDGFQWSILVDDAFPYHTHGSMLTTWDGNLVYAGSNGSLSISSDGIEWTHFEVGASTRVLQIMNLGDDILLNLGIRGLIQSRAVSSEDIQPTNEISLDFASRSVEAKIGKPTYPERQYGVLLQSNDMRKWTSVENADYIEETEYRRASAAFELGEDGTAFFRNGYVSVRDLFGPWIAREQITVDACGGASASSESKNYFVSMRTKENQSISIELLDTDDLSATTIFNGTFDSDGIFALTATKSTDTTIQGQQFEARIGIENGAPLITLSLTHQSEDGCPSRHEISLTR